MNTTKQCQGCIDDQPNQQAHMNPGGCLYDDFDMTYSLSNTFEQEKIVSTSRPTYYEVAPCVVCIFQELQSEYSDSSCRAMKCSSRCKDHQLQCVVCKNPVHSDCFLLCTGCWNENRLNTLYKPTKKQPSPDENRLCLYTSRIKTLSECWACGCISCKRSATLLEVSHPFTISEQ